ncbi:ABC transporter [Gymnopus androsaceus JB14]|uniref:ABC transporter n=1 Tax=Gymnopus androsaceus JB14 TaxID=1447944 RepID=A0A6A4HBP5_9AGAR|nr:ABC transporter [Gymnopus androsaceus JB14]
MASLNSTPTSASPGIHHDPNENTSATTFVKDEKTELQLAKTSTMVASESTILTGRKLVLVYIAMLLSLMVVALDSTILATPLPRIASDFDAFNLQGWVATAFVLAQTIFILFYGQLLRIFPPKWILVACIAIFEVGSLACALAQNINTMIAGRAVTGLGAAGIWVAILQIIAQISHLENRAILLGGFQFVFGFASVAGPLVGGAFTDDVTWRWCFYINLPIGGASVLAIVLFLKASPPLGSDLNKRTRRHLLQQTLSLDLGGVVLVAGFVTSLVLALQWGGNTKPWGDKDVVICFVLAGVTVVALIFWERYQGEHAMIPLAIFRSKSIYALVMYCGLNQVALLLFSYYIPIFYQAARHSTATHSGIDTLPFLLSVILSVVAGSLYVSKSGRYWPILVVSPIFLALGSGLLYSLQPDTKLSNVIGYQILAGIGTGLGIQNPFIALQVEFQYTPDLLGQAMSMGSFWQVLGGTVGLGMAEPIFASQLSKHLKLYAPTAPASVVTQSPTAIYSTLSPFLIPGVVHSYTEALKAVFLVGVPVAILALLASFLVNNIKILKSLETEPEKVIMRA